MKDLFRQSDINLLPSQLKSGIFIVMIDDNLDANSAPVHRHSAVMHFYGAGSTMLQYPTESQPGERRIKKGFSEKNEKTEESSAVDSYTTVKQVQMPKTWHYPIQTVNISDEFEADLDDLFKLESGNEYRWLDKIAKKSASIQRFKLWQM